jgi:hypothetical protein
MIRCGEKLPPLAPGEKRATHPKGFFRKGKAGGWHETLVGAELEEVERVSGELLTQLGYDLSTPSQSCEPVA